MFLTQSLRIERGLLFCNSLTKMRGDQFVMLLKGSPVRYMKLKIEKSYSSCGKHSICCMYDKMNSTST